MKKLFLVLTIMCIGINTYSQKNKKVVFNNEIEIKQTLEKIVSDLSYIDKVDRATKTLISLAPQLKDDFKQHNEKFKNDLSSYFNQEFGSVIGHQLVKERRINDILYEATYVVKFEEYGVYLRFQFYNGKNNQWRLSNYRHSDKISELLK